MSRDIRPIGIIDGWDQGRVSIILMDPEYLPGLGDILYTKKGSSIILLQVSGFKGELPVASQSILSLTRGDIPASYSLQKVMTIEATPFFEIRYVDGNKPIVIKPTSPPLLESPVYRLVPGDKLADEIMKELSTGIKPVVRGGRADYIPVAWLRSGIAPSEELRKEKYFTEAPLEIDLSKSIPKHILVAGQTGAGKTTSVMGMIIAWALHGEEKLSWLIIDRHGEYSVYNDKRDFLWILEDALRLNDKLVQEGLRVYAYSIRTRTDTASIRETNVINILPGPVSIKDINVYDAGMALNLSQERISDLEEVLSILASIIKATDLPENWRNVFINENDEPTGNMLALLPLLVDNMFNHEGVGEKEKKGLYKIIMSAGIDIRRLRMFRRLILNLFGLTRKYKTIETSTGKISVAVLDDENSAFKITPLLKDPIALVKVMKALVDTAKKNYHVGQGKYMWLSVSEKNLEEHAINVTEALGISIDEITEKAMRGNIVVLDVSKIPISQGDVIVMSVIRRIFEKRMSMGVDVIRAQPTISIVSEEAPLYLSPENVKSPYNVFARIAREGRKFKIGLIAITQLATQIEHQILANFNTMIALRTKYTSDINYYKGIGIPGETLPTLGDREGYLYTPDLQVKEPIPVYVPGFYEYREIIDNYTSKKKAAEEKENRIKKGLEALVEEDEEI